MDIYKSDSSQKFPVHSFYLISCSHDQSIAPCDIFKNKMAKLNHQALSRRLKRLKLLKYFNLFNSKLQLCAY